MGFFRDLENKNLADQDHKITKDIWLSIAKETVLLYEENFNTQAERINFFQDKFEKQYEDVARSFLIAVDEQVIELPYEHTGLLSPRVEDLYVDILIRDTALCIRVLGLHSNVKKKLRTLGRWLSK